MSPNGSGTSNVPATNSSCSGVPGTTITLTEPKHLVAAQCGTAPEVLSRTFRRLEDEGILEVEGETVRVLDADRLQTLAEWIDEVG